MNVVTHYTTNKVLLNSMKLPFIFTLLFISSCHKQSNHKVKAVLTDWSQVSSWSFKGKMSIKSEHESGTGRISWNTNNIQTQAEFKAPLGQGSWKITELPHSSSLYSSKFGTTTANNTDMLISTELGWSFPWSSLSYWLRGSKTDQIKTNNSPIKTIEELGWKIQFSKWTTTPIGLLPKSIKAEKSPYAIKLFIYEWNIIQKQ